MQSFPSSESVAYHAARLILLIQYCGSTLGQKESNLPGIEGRTLLAKLDFFIRYPTYLKRAVAIRSQELAKPLGQFTDEDFGITSDTEEQTVEARMIRYKYGPWDHIYYIALAYLIGKQLIEIELKRSTEVFRLTKLGFAIGTQLSEEPAYQDIVRRSQTTKRVFLHYKGATLKAFIYSHFPEVVNRKLGETI